MLGSLDPVVGCLAFHDPGSRTEAALGDPRPGHLTEGWAESHSEHVGGGAKAVAHAPARGVERTGEGDLVRVQVAGQQPRAMRARIA